MKTILSLLIIILLFSCKDFSTFHQKKNIDKGDATNVGKVKTVDKRIVGQWIWTSKSGGITGKVTLNKDNQKDIVLIIDEELYRNYHFGTLFFESTYQLDLEKGIIKFKSGLELGIELSDTKLILKHLYPDGMMVVYRKVNKEK